MSGTPRILQAGDFSLHEPLLPVVGVSEMVRTRLIGAREEAARTVFETALRKSVDLLLLTGDLGDCDDDPGIAWFLYKQIRRLSDAEIQTVWVSPPNVPHPPLTTDLARFHRVSIGQTISLPMIRSQRTVEISCCADQSARGGPGTGLRVRLQPAASSGWEIGYSIGGQKVSFQHPAGTIQRRGYGCAGNPGMWLIECCSTECVPQFLPTEVVHWCQEIVTINDGMTLSHLKEELAERIRGHQTAARHPIIILRWLFTGNGPLWNQLLHPQVILQLLSSLNGNAVQSGSLVWSDRIDCCPDVHQIDRWIQNEHVANALDDLEVDQVSTEQNDSPLPIDRPHFLKVSRLAPHTFMRLVHTLRNAPATRHSVRDDV